LVHFKPLAQGLQFPPQFRSVSVPFWTLSEQDGVAHTVLLHHPFLQSASMLHFFPSMQDVVLARQLRPPQSRSVSC
jgi:hypothetical protein